MFIPARKTRGPDQACTRMPRLLSVATTGAVFMGAGFGVMPAAADAQPEHELSVTVDIVGDSYMAGEGLTDTYIDPADPRHRSSAAPALQALARVQSDNPRLRVDANLVASSGAETVDYFHAQAGPDNTLVNAPQHDQVRPNSQLVIVGFGGDDARLATVLADARTTTSGPNTVLDKEIQELAPLLDSTATDEEFIAQATSSPPGQAPTLVARILQVLAGVAARAPHAKIVVTTYPLAADPDNAHAASLIGEDELTSVRKFGYDLNKAIDRAVQICNCGSLADISEALAGHEIYTADSAYDESRDQQAPQKAFQPNDKGASLIANPIADSIANVLQITAPKPSDGRMTDPENIDIRGGVSDRDGDTVADSQDKAPDDPARSTDAPQHEGNTKHGTDDETSSHKGSKSNHANDTRQPHGGVLQPIIQVLAPGVSPIGPYDKPKDPAGDNHSVTVENRPPAREQTAPAVPTAQAPEPAAAGPVPGEDPSPPTRAQNAAMKDVISKAEPVGYVSKYSTQALRATVLPADVRVTMDKRAVDEQMNQSLLTQVDTGVRDGFRVRFSSDIDAIHNATTVAEQNAAIARFDQTAREYNATELAERDAYGAHPVDAQGETVRMTPTSLAELADVSSETTTYGPVAQDAVSTVSDQAPAQAQTFTVSNVADVPSETTTYGSVDTSTLAAVSDQAPAQSAQSVQTVAAADTPAGFNRTVGPVGEVNAEGTTQIGDVTVTGKISDKALGGEVNANATDDGFNAQAGGYVGQVNGEVSAKTGGVEAGLKGTVTGADVGFNASMKSDKDGFSAKVGAHGNVVDGTVDGSVKSDGQDVVGAKGNFSIGAEAEAHVSATSKDHAAGAKAFAGVKYGGEVNAPEVAGVTVGFRAAGLAGVGGELSAGYNSDKGKYSYRVDAGLAPLLGFKAGLTVTVDPDKFQKSLDDALDALNPWGPVTQPDQAPPSDVDSEYTGPTPGTTGENDDPADAPAPATTDNDAEYSGPTPGTTGENDDPAPASAEPAAAPAATDNDANYSGPTPGTTGENDDPGYSINPAADSPVDSDAAISSDTDPASDTIAGEAADDSLTGDAGDDTIGGETDTGEGDTGVSDDGMSDSGFGDTSDGADTSDATGGLGDGASDGDSVSGGDSVTGGGGDFGGGGATGDFGGDSTGVGTSGVGDSDSGTSGDSGMGSDSSGMGSDSGSMGGDSGTSGDSSGMGGDSGGMGGDSGGSTGGGDSGGGDSGGGDGGGGDGGGSTGSSGMGGSGSSGGDGGGGD